MAASCIAGSGATARKRARSPSVEDLGGEMRACGSEAILLLVQLVHRSSSALPPWARQPARRIVTRYHAATNALGKEFDAQAKDHRR